jgi:hypothetical protein
MKMDENWFKDFIHAKDNKYFKHSSLWSLKNNMAIQISF